MSFNGDKLSLRKSHTNAGVIFSGEYWLQSQSNRSSGTVTRASSGSITPRKYQYSSSCCLQESKLEWNTYCTERIILGSHRATCQSIEQRGFSNVGHAYNTNSKIVGRSSQYQLFFSVCAFLLLLLCFAY